MSPVQGLEQHVFTEHEKYEFASKPGVLLEYRKNVERGLNGQFGIFLKGTKTSTDTHSYMKKQMQEKLHNEILEEKLIPDWSVGCRRLTPGVGYLESLSKPNVEVVYGEINEVTERGCLCDDGKEYPIDVLICATGFDTGFKPRFPIVGPNGRNLQDVWAGTAESYLGVAAASFPNYLIFLGPNCPIGNGPVLCAIGTSSPLTLTPMKVMLTCRIECQADYMCKLIDRYQTHNIKSFSPKQEAVDDFIAYKDFFMARTVWNDPCRSWYKAAGPDGKVTALWPGSTLHYMEAMEELRLEDWNVEYEGNRFAYLGNGYSQCEIDQTADWGYYIRESDDGAPLSLGKRRKIVTKSGTVDNSAIGAVDFSGRKAEAEPNAQARL